MQNELALCKLCGEPMPKGEEMFFYHGSSGPCPKPHLPRKPTDKELLNEAMQLIYSVAVIKCWRAEDKKQSNCDYVRCVSCASRAFLSRIDQAAWKVGE